MHRPDHGGRASRSKGGLIVPRSHKVLGSLLILVMGADVQAGTASASFGIRITIEPPPCMLRVKGETLKIACDAHGHMPRVLVDERRAPRQVEVEKNTRVVSITY